MAIRMSGLNSGIDTDSIVSALMSAQRMKQTKVENKKTKLEWKQEIWSGLNTKLYNFYTSSLSKIKLQTTFKTKAAASSDTSKVTATANANASEGTYRVKVNALASAQYVTSGKLKGARVTDESGKVTTEEVTNSTKLTDILDAGGNKGFAAGTQLAITSKDGLSTLTVDESTTVGDFVSACKSAGLTASFDETQQRFFIGSNTSGADQKFTITASTLSQAQLDAVSGLKNAVGYAYLDGDDQSAVSRIFDQIQSGEKTYADVSEQLKEYTEKAQEKAVNDYYKNQITQDYQSQYFADADHKTVSAAGKAAYIAAGNTEEAYNALTDTEKASAVESLITKKVNEDLATEVYQNRIEDGVKNGVGGASEAFVAASADQRISTLQTVAEAYHTTMSGSVQNNAALSYLGLGEVTGDAVSEVNGDGMVVVKASDSSITYNGATLTSSDSTLSVNGLTLNVIGLTNGEEVTISVTKDTSAVYDTIKDFISEYNTILKEMNTKYNAVSARDYDVLTDEQKEAMSDDEVEKWEGKIKDSLLRRDDTLNSLISSFRNDMMGSYRASNGKSYSLASLGITTSTDYSERGLLHIKGDEDDEEYGDETNKLEKMLSEDPDIVMEVLTGVTSTLYSDLQKKMSVTKMSSALTFYNDKEMKTQLTDYKDEIKKWQEKLADLEDRYYSQFTAMETAMAKLNSQQNYFSSMLGG